MLQAHDGDLTREYPFMCWSSSLTKPDWSANDPDLWVELKYVRQRADIRQITEDIAADITKYGDNGRHVLFVVYDPKHLIVDDGRFAEPIHRRPTMRARLIR
jgi:hypothetical protein